MIIEVVLEEVLVIEVTIFGLQAIFGHLDAASGHLREEVGVFGLDQALGQISVPCPRGLMGPHDEGLIKHVWIVVVLSSRPLQEFLVIEKSVLGPADSCVKLAVGEGLRGTHSGWIY